MTKRAQEGSVLAIVLIAAVVFSIATIGMLIVVLNQRQRTKEFDVDRMRARYTAEAALVWANEQLWANPAFCYNASPPAPFNTLNQFPNGAVNVEITNCGAASNHQVKVTVTY